MSSLVDDDVHDHDDDDMAHHHARTTSHSTFVADEALAQQLQQEEEESYQKLVHMTRALASATTTLTTVDGTTLLCQDNTNADDGRRRLPGDVNDPWVAIGSSTATAATTKTPPPGRIAATMYRLPTLVDSMYYWIYTSGPSMYSNAETAFGKWLIFESSDHIDDLWKQLYPTVSSGQLQAHSIKVSTRYCSHSTKQKGTNDSHVICVYTSKERIDTVGQRLLPLVQRTIRYKTNQATQDGIYYAHQPNKARGRVSYKTMVWKKTSYPTDPTSLKRKANIIDPCTNHSPSDSQQCSSLATTDDVPSRTKRKRNQSFYCN